MQNAHFRRGMFRLLTVATTAAVLAVASVTVASADSPRTLAADNHGATFSAAPVVPAGAAGPSPTTIYTGEVDAAGTPVILATVPETAVRAQTVGPYRMLQTPAGTIRLVWSWGCKRYANATRACPKPSGPIPQVSGFINIDAFTWTRQFAFRGPAPGALAGGTAATVELNAVDPNTRFITLQDGPREFNTFMTYGAGANAFNDGSAIMAKDPPNRLAGGLAADFIRNGDVFYSLRSVKMVCFTDIKPNGLPAGSGPRMHGKISWSGGYVMRTRGIDAAGAPILERVNGWTLTANLQPGNQPVCANLKPVTCNARHRPSVLRGKVKCPRTRKKPAAPAPTPTVSRSGPSGGNRVL